VTDGAYVHRGGRKHLKQTKHPGLSCAPRTKTRWLIVRSLISNASLWIWPDPEDIEALFDPKQSIDLYFDVVLPKAVDLSARLLGRIGMSGQSLDYSDARQQLDLEQ
jgi:hypothetical protein